MYLFLLWAAVHHIGVAEEASVVAIYFVIEHAGIAREVTLLNLSSAAGAGEDPGSLARGAALRGGEPLVVVRDAKTGGVRHEEAAGASDGGTAGVGATCGVALSVPADATEERAHSLRLGVVCPGVAIHYSINGD